MMVISSSKVMGMSHIESSSSMLYTFISLLGDRGGRRRRRDEVEKLEVDYCTY